MNKYNAKRVYSELCQREFDSKAERIRGEELRMLELAGEISNLEYQVPFQLCLKPNIKIKVDFKYNQNGCVVYEDAKGMMTREFRVKLAWLKEKHDVEVKLVK